MKSRILYTWTGPTVVLVGAVSYLPVRHSLIQADRTRVFEQTIKDDIAGTRQPVPGPYLAEGNVAELKLWPVDLGESDFVQMSERGDVLYQIAKKTFRLRKANGETITFPNAKDIKLFPDGRTVRVRPTSGRQFQTYDSSVSFGSDMDQPSVDGLYRSHGIESVQCETLDGLGYREVRLEPNRRAYMIASSTKLGTFGQVTTDTYLAETFPKDQIIQVKDFVSRTIDLPKDVHEPWMTAGRDALYLTSSSVRGVTTLWEYRQEKFTKLPVIPQTGRQVLYGANTDRDLLLDLEFTPHQRGKGGFHGFYVSKGRYYSLSDLAKRFSLTYERQARFGPALRTISEDGDFVFMAKKDGASHLVLMKKLG